MEASIRSTTLASRCACSSDRENKCPRCPPSPQAPSSPRQVVTERTQHPTATPLFRKSKRLRNGPRARASPIGATPRTRAGLTKHSLETARGPTTPVHLSGHIAVQRERGRPWVGVRFGSRLRLRLRFRVRVRASAHRSPRRRPQSPSINSISYPIIA